MRAGVTSVRFPASPTSTMTYRGDGLRVGVQSQEQNRIFVWDENRYLLESGEGSTVFTGEPTMFGKLISQHSDGESSWSHFDARGDARSWTGDAETVLASMSYGAWGDTVSNTGSPVSSFQFCGEDGYNSGLAGCYVRARTYDTLTGRWMSPDPSLLTPYSQLYHYVENSPVSDTDPSGLFQVPQRPQKPHPDFPEIPYEVLKRIIRRNKCLFERESCPQRVGIWLADPLALACHCLRRAELLLSKYPKKLTKYIRGKKLPKSTAINKLLVPAGLNRMLRMVKKSLKRCSRDTKAPLHFCCPKQCDPGTEAYVDYYIGTNWRSDTCINLCPSFFKGGLKRRRGILLHEMARFDHSMGESLSGTWNDAYVWDDILIGPAGTPLCSDKVFKDVTGKQPPTR